MANGRTARFGAIALLALGLAACGERTPVEAPPEAAPADTCQTASDPFRRTVICADPTLAALDQSIRDEFATQAQAAGEPLSEASALQDAWLDAQRIACGVASPTSPLSEDQRSCLTSALQARSAGVGAMLQTVGDYQFRQMEFISATPVSPALAASSGLGAFAPAAITREIRYPRITGEQTPEVRRFNELVRQEPRFRTEDQTSETVNYAIAYAGPDLISVRFDLYDEPLSAPHGMIEVRAVSVNMRTGALLSADDIFRPGADWENFITRRAAVELARAFEGSDFVPSLEDVRETATKPPQWLVTQTDLIILFPPLSFAGPQLEGGQQVAIPWSELRAYLRPEAPRPIGQAL